MTPAESTGAPGGVRTVLDHLVLATTDDRATAAALGRRLGVTPAPGGAHPGLGTRNSLLSFGGPYLEVIGPDPDQPDPSTPRPFGIDELAPGEERFTAWCGRPDDLDAAAASGRAAGYLLGPVLPMSRATPEGTTLEWRLALPEPAAVDPTLPFLIDWGTTPHPSTSTPGGVELVEWSVAHPKAARIQAVLDALGADLPIGHAEQPAVSATLRGPAGEVRLG